MLTPHGHVEHALHVVDDGETTWLTTRAGHRRRRSSRGSTRCASAPGRGRRRHRRLGRRRGAVRTPSSVAGAVDLGRPVADRRAGSVAMPTTRCRTRRRLWTVREVLVPRADLAGLTAAAPDVPGCGRYEALRVEARRPRLGFETDHRTIPHEVDWLAHRRAPGQGLLPRPGDRRPGAQPRPAAAPPGAAAPRRLRGRRCPSHGDAGTAGRPHRRLRHDRRPPPRARARSRSPWSSATSRSRRRSPSTAPRPPRKSSSPPDPPGRQITSLLSAFYRAGEVTGWACWRSTTCRSGARRSPRTRCARFYGALGFVEVPKPPVLAARGGFWMRAASGVELHVGREPDHRPSSKAHPAVLVDDLAAARTRSSRRVRSSTRTTASCGRRYTRAQTRDPAGNRLELVQRLAAE